MKKSFVALLVVLALIVLISPGIVGRLAEKSMDENLDWAAAEAEEVVVSSQGFDRGWFSSEGQHRIEIKDGELRDLLLAYTNADMPGELPALIIDTRIDHGLIPVTSMSREKGSLVPGLGSAVSTVGFEAGGEVVPLPGKIYSTVGLTGELHSNYVLEPGSFTHDGATARWGGVDVKLNASPTTGAVVFDVSIASFAVDSMADNVRIENIRFSGKQAPSGFGFRVGPVQGFIGSISIDDPVSRFGDGTGREPLTTLGPMTIDASSSIDGGRLTATTRIEFENAPFQDFGRAGIVFDARIVEADGRAIGYIKRGLEDAQRASSSDVAVRTLDSGAKDLVAAGLELHIDEARISLPQGLIESELHIAVAEIGADGFTWPKALLATEAVADFSIGEELVQLAMAANPEVGGIIGMGYLRKNGDVYEMHAEFKKGLLTVNGAPIPVPLNRLQ